MKEVLDFIVSLEIWVYAAAGGGVVVIVGLLLYFIPRMRFRKRLLKVSKTPDLAALLIGANYSPQRLLSRSGMIERAAIRLDDNDLPNKVGVNELWIERLQQTKSPRILKRVLRFIPEQGLFISFITTLERPKLAAILNSWLEESKDFLPLRSIARSGKGEEFDGAAAKATLSDRLGEIREMTGDPEWASRYFAVKILINDDEERSMRAIWDAFRDPHPLVRRTVVTEYTHEDRERLYGEAKSLLLDDPVYEVRNAARQRIHADFAADHTIDIDSLSSWQAQHVLELLDPASKDDENIATHYLESENLEMRLTAALYLSKAGALDRLFNEVDFGDREGLERNYGLLEKACEVNVASFLKKIKRQTKPESLLIAARLLTSYGDVEGITDLAEAVFSQSDEKKLSSGYFDIYQTVLESVSRRGNESALDLLTRELMRHQQNSQFLDLILAALPPRGEYIFTDNLLAFLKKPDFPSPDALRNALLKVSKSRVLPVLIEMLKKGRAAYSHGVRIDTLKLLGEMKVDYSLQTILEHLPILPVEEAKEFSKTLAEYAGKTFDEKTAQLLATSDANVRAALISSLPATGKKDFLKQIRDSLGDADPGVRIAAIWSLLDFDDTRTVNQSFDMLRDPVEQVRGEVARAIGSCATSQRIENLRDLVTDENEVDSVKAAAIEGLGYSVDPGSVNALCQVYESSDDYRKLIEVALSKKTERRLLTRIVEQFKDAVPALKQGISDAAILMGEAGETTMVDLLREGIATLKPYLAEILEATGYLESQIRKLSHRDPAIRRTAAEILSLVETKSAFRGIVLAARDPDEEVRVSVTKALEKLATDEGKSILEDLQNDPDRRVRKYTAWALERLRAKSL